MTATGRPRLKVDRRPLEQLREDPENARRHGAENLAAIRASLERFGQQRPLIARPDGTIVAGNGTYAAARELGWDAVDVVLFDGSDEEARALAIADNRTAELAEWDLDRLAENLGELVEAGWELIDLGWEEFPSLDDPTPPSSFARHDDDAATAYRCPKCHYEWNGSPR